MKTQGGGGGRGGRPWNRVAKRGFKRGILRDLELINAEGEAGEGGGGSREDVGETPRVRGVKRGCR